MLAQPLDVRDQMPGRVFFQRSMRDAISRPSLIEQYDSIGFRVEEGAILCDQSAARTAVKKDGRLTVRVPALLVINVMDFRYLKHPMLVRLYRIVKSFHYFTHCWIKTDCRFPSFILNRSRQYRDTRRYGTGSGSDRVPDEALSQPAPGRYRSRYRTNVTWFDLEEDPLNEPVASRQDHDHRADGRDSLAELLIAIAQRRQKRGHDHDDAHLPDLHAEIEREERPAQRPARQAEFPQHARESEAMHEAEEERYPGARIPARLAYHEVVNADINNAQRNGRLDKARRRIEHVQRGERQGNAVVDGEGGDDGQQPHQASSHQQQPHDEEDVIRPGKDVIDPEGDELFHYGQRDLPAAGKVVEGRMVIIEDFLTRE